MTRIKICGITRIEDALTAQEAGADAIGFIFYKKSKRYIDPLTVRAIVQKLNPFINKVGVFVNESPENINAIAIECGLTNVQLHGQEGVEMARRVNLPVIKAINFDKNLTENLLMWHDFNIMIDSGNNRKPGGTGKTLPWKVLKELVKNRPIILAGGLNPDNVIEAIHLLNPVAVDVSSGVEKSPGLKDRDLIKNFIKNIHSNI